MTPASVQALPFVLAALIAAAAVSFVLGPVAIRFAHRVGAIDLPDSTRRVHREPTPRAGGIAVVVSFVLVGIGAIVANDVIGRVPQVRVLPAAALVVLFGGAVVAGLIGFVDDRWQLRARWQLLGQLGLALLVVAGGITIRFVDDPLGARPITFNDELAMVITVLWVVGMINSINFIDGLDGLSTGISLIAAVTLGVISLAVLGQPSVALLCAVLAGALAGFLPWNFHPARVFIGTTGVFAVGFALSVLSILVTAKVAVALLVLGVPIIDTFWIILRRLFAKQSPFTPDRGHFHHRLLDLGLTHRGAVLVIYAICIALALLSLVLSGQQQLYTFTGILVGGGLILYLMTRRAQEALDARTYDDDEPTDALTTDTARDGREDVSATDGPVARGRDEHRPAGDRMRS